MAAKAEEAPAPPQASAAKPERQSAPEARQAARAGRQAAAGGQADAGIYINQTPGTTGLATSVINGLVSRDVDDFTLVAQRLRQRLQKLGSSLTDRIVSIAQLFLLPAHVRTRRQHCRTRAAGIQPRSP